MKGLLKYLSPFSPDQSGAVSVLFSLGGIIVIADAGGCTGNICGFDEPRWFQEKSAVFSAGLRDMDAILGRDDRMVDKIKDAATQIGGNFAAVIGTPVPAVIATDFKAMKRMAAKRCNIPVMTVECTGTRLYDQGAEEAYLEVFRTFALGADSDKADVKAKDCRTDVKAGEDTAIDKEDCGQKKALGILGLIPLDINRLKAKEELTAIYKDYDNIYCYGMGDGLEAIKKAGSVEKNIVVSPAAVKVAEYLKERFGTPYEMAFPFEQVKGLDQIRDKNVLVVGQQIAADEIRKELEKQGNKVTIGTWFKEIESLKRPGDVHFDREDRFIDYVMSQDYDLIIADPAFKRALKEYRGMFIENPHFAVSGKLYEGEK